MGTIRTGEEVAALYRRHVGMVYQICLMLLKNVPDAEDATQTVFQKARSTTSPFVIRSMRRRGSLSPPAITVKTSLKHWWRTRRAGRKHFKH